MKIETYLKRHRRDLSSQVIVITGANSGIGFEAAKIFASWGATVVFACRNEAKAQEAMKEITNEFMAAKLVYLPYDQASFVSIKNFVSALKASFPKIDAIVFNAGIYHPKKNLLTTDGLPLTVGTNYVGLVYLFNELLSQKALDYNYETRLIFVGSLVWGGRQRWFNFEEMCSPKLGVHRQYVYSKTLIGKFVVELQKTRVWNGITLSPAWQILLTHPGVSGTNIVNTNATGFSKSFKRLADFVLYLFVHHPQKASLGIVTWLSLEEINEPNLIYAPRGIKQISGFPTLKKVPKALGRDGAKLHQITLEILEKAAC